MSSKEILAVDIDDVLSPSAPAFIEFTNERWRRNQGLGELALADYTENWFELWDVEQEEFNNRKKQWFETGTLGQLEPIEGAKQSLAELRERFDIVAVTSRSIALKALTDVWIDTHFGNSINDVVYAGIFDKLDNEFAHLRTKRDTYARLKPTAVVDDQPKHCIAAHDLGITPVLFGEYGWNETVVPVLSEQRAPHWVRVAPHLQEAA